MKISLDNYTRCNTIPSFHIKVFNHASQGLNFFRIVAGKYPHAYIVIIKYTSFLCHHVLLGTVVLYIIHYKAGWKPLAKARLSHFP